MQKKSAAIVFLVSAIVLFFSFSSIAQDISIEGVTVVSAEVRTSPSIEVTFLSSTETLPLITGEAISSTSKETISIITLATAETASVEAGKSQEEGASYKGVPWGADFSTFKALKGFPGNLGPLSAAFIGTVDDNDIALLLGVPVTARESSGGQRVMFEYVPRNFASVYFEPDDTNYIFYNGKFAFTLSKINSKNFDLYRDTFYKKYKKLLDYSKKFALSKKNYYQLQAAIFEKGKTNAFLIKSEFNNGKKTFASAKLLFAYKPTLDAIRKEIDEKLAADKLSSGEKDKQDLQKDLNKIE